MKLEQLIERHRPPAADEGKPAGEAQLLQLNRYGLMPRAVERQLERDADDPKPWNHTVIRKITAWEVLAEAQRNGLRITSLTDRD